MIYGANSAAGNEIFNLRVSIPDLRVSIPILAARNPLQNCSLIWLTVWLSGVHGGIMAVQSFNGMHAGHLYGDVLVLFADAAVLAYLAPRRDLITAA